MQIIRACEFAALEIINVQSFFSYFFNIIFNMNKIFFLLSLDLLRKSFLTTKSYELLRSNDDVMILDCRFSIVHKLYVAISYK